MTPPSVRRAWHELRVCASCVPALSLARAGLHSPEVEPPSLSRHAVCVVAAARCERPRRRRRRRAATPWPYGHGARAVDPGARPAGRTPRASARRARRLRGDRPRASRLAPQHHGDPGGRAREPRARAGAGKVRHRPRLRARRAKPVVPRAPRHRGPGRGDVLLARAPLLSPGQGAASPAAGPDRRAARNLAGYGGRRRASASPATTR